jgi:hypothetical protein
MDGVRLGNTRHLLDQLRSTRHGWRRLAIVPVGAATLAVLALVSALRDSHKHATRLGWALALSLFVALASGGCGNQATYLDAQTTPAGANLEVGLQTVNNVIMPGTGRKVGTTPIKAQLQPSDVLTVNGFASVEIRLTLAGYCDGYWSVSLGPGGTLTPGDTYPLQETLTKLGGGCSPLPTYLYAQTTPAHAQLEVGLQTVNGIVTPGTGRKVGHTPFRAELLPSDVDTTNNGFANLSNYLTLPGYYDWGCNFGLGQGGTLPPGRIYTCQHTMTPLPPTPTP